MKNRKIERQKDRKTYGQIEMYMERQKDRKIDIAGCVFFLRISLGMKKQLACLIALIIVLMIWKPWPAIAKLSFLPFCQQWPNYLFCRPFSTFYSFSYSKLLFIIIIQGNLTETSKSLPRKIIKKKTLKEINVYKVSCSIYNDPLSVIL